MVARYSQRYQPRYEYDGIHPEEFDPSRFTEEGKKQQKPYSFIPFGGGMHQCGGRKFALNSLKASLTWLL